MLTPAAAFAQTPNITVNLMPPGSGSQGPHIASVLLNGGNGATYFSGIASGATIAPIVVTMSDGSTYTGNLSLSGTYGADFTVTNTALKSNGSTPTCATAATNYNFNIVAAAGPGESGATITAPETVMCSPSSRPTAMSPLTASVQDNLGSGVAIVTVNVAMSDGSIFNGTCASTDSTYTTVAAVSGGCQLSSRRAYSSTDDGTHTFSLSATENGLTLSGQSFSLTIYNGTSTSNFGKYLIGIGSGDWTDMGADTGLANPQIRGCGNMSITLGQGSLPSNCQFPMYMSMNSIDDTSNSTDVATAASGGYDSTWAANLATYVDPYASYIYYIRIDSEWQAQSNTYSPFYGSAWGDESHPNLSAADWNSAFQHLVNVIRADSALSNVKIAFDSPQNTTEQSYYPGDSYVDLFTYDLYFGLGGGPTGQDSWNTYSANLSYMDTFAAAHSKPYALPEWCDFFTDGYVIGQMGNWINTHNVVDQNYWNTTFGAQDTNGNYCTLNSSQAKEDAFKAAFGNYSYTGTFWPGGVK